MNSDFDRPETPGVFQKFRLIIGALLVVLVLMGAYLCIWPGTREQQRFTVEKGASAQAVAQNLYAARLIGSRLLFRLWVKIHGREGAPRPGAYTLAPGWTGWRNFQQLRQGPPLVRVTFPEGWTSQQMAELLQNRGVTSGAEFLALVKKEQREGFLFPDTYFFSPGVSPEQVVARMIRRFHEAEPKDLAAQAKAFKLSYRQIVTVASLIEREARAPSERPIIAGVFYNRLRKKWRLESCATVEYALGGWRRRLTYKDLEVDSPYNTYKHAGLPPGPICNPGKAALEAAAHPAVTDALFFVSDGQGTHRFTRYYSEHLEGRKQLKKK